MTLQWLIVFHVLYFRRSHEDFIKINETFSELLALLNRVGRALVLFIRILYDDSNFVSENLSFKLVILDGIQELIRALFFFISPNRTLGGWGIFAWSALLSLARFLPRFKFIFLWQTFIDGLRDIAIFRNDFMMAF